MTFRLTFASLLAISLTLATPTHADLLPQNLPTGQISTLAGTGASGFAGDGGSASDAQLVDPRGLLISNDGSLVFADVSTEIGTIVRRIDVESGLISAVAGDGGTEFDLFGASGPALEFSLAEVGDVAQDEDGNLYLSETALKRVLRVDPSGTISMVIGAEGTFGFSPLSAPTGLCYADGALYVADVHQLFRHDLATGETDRIAGGLFDGFSGDDGLATFSRLNGVTDLVVDPSGHLYFADSGNQRIRRIDAVTDTITTVAYLQDLPATVDNPDADSRTIQDLEVWGDGSLIIAEPGIIWQLSPGGDTLIVAGQGTVGSTGNNGPATDAGIGVRSIAADTTGNLFIGDSSHTIRVVSGGILLIEPEPVPDPEPPVTSVPDPDFDSDGSVGFQDFLLFAAVFGKNVGDDGYDSKFDLDGSVDIGFGDFLAFAAAFGT